jgi:hypothetical protein
LETFGYRTANGYEERERLVVSRGQGHVHVHIHPAGRDLFVSWQAHLNWAQWSETAPVTHRDAGTSGIVYRDLKPSWYVPTDFDLIDLDSLSSVVHSTLEREIRALAADRNIDQEIDFEVNRGDRASALDAREAWPERSTKRSRNSNVIFGAGGIRRAELGEMQLAPADLKPPGAARGLAAIPAVVSLPILVALGYFWLYESGAFRFYLFELAVSPTFKFTFSPLYQLPFAVVLAFGLWLYAGVRLIHALLVVALVETLVFGVSYVYQLWFSYLLTSREFAMFVVANAAAAALSGMCYLLAASLWVPALRDGRRWLAAIVLWALWGACVYWALREFRFTGTLGTMVGASTRIFMAACFGYWLWREQAGVSWARSLLPTLRAAPAQRQATRRTAARRTPTPAAATVEGGWKGAALGVLFLALGIVAFNSAQELPGWRGFAMGPGTMPTALSVLLIATGAIVAIEGLVRQRMTVPASLAPLVWVLAAAAAFGLAIRPLGLVAAIILTTAILAVYAERTRVAHIMLAVVISVAIVLMLGGFLNLPLALWPNPRVW